jgi:hypothetical protein
MYSHGNRISLSRLARFSLSILALGLSSVVANVTASSWRFEKVVQDVPGKLTLEVTPPIFRFQPATDGSSMQVTCSGCQRNGIPGSPDLPVYRFDVLSGVSNPQVNITVLESETRTMSGGIAPYPLAITPARMEFRVNPKFYTEASALKGRVLNTRYLRGTPIRGIEIPLSTWSENGKVLTLIKRMQVEVLFDGVQNSPATNRLQAAFAGNVKNPIGGAYLYQSARMPALRKSAAAKFTFGNRYLSIKIGDRFVETMDEDRIYGLSFADLVRASSDLSGAIQINNLRMYTGINDSLPRRMSSQVASGTIREIPIEVIDRNGNQTFDEGDSIRFFGHGTTVWKRFPGNRGPIRYEWSTDPYAFENFYYLDYTEGGKTGPALRLSVTASPPATLPQKTFAYHYLHAEKDLQTAACDPSSHKDEETGFVWFWHWKGECGGSDSGTTLTKAQLASDETDSIPDLDQSIPNDSLYFGLYITRVYQDSSSKVYYGGQGDTLEILRVSVEDTTVIPTPAFSPGSYYVWTGALKAAPIFQLDSVRWNREHRFEGYSVVYRKKFTFHGKPMWIFPSDFGKPVTYKIQDGPGLKCLKVESGVATTQFVLDAQGTFTDSLGQNADVKYYLYRDLPATPQIAVLEQQTLPATNTALRNLETGDGENPEYLIVTAAPLLEAALKLKEYRNQSQRAVKVRTSVVLVEDIYRQFSSGRMSPVAIRDFLRWAYRGWGVNGSGASALKYVVFFGDGHYDYRNIRATVMKSPPPNMVPPYEFFGEGRSEEIASDDFYAALDSNDNELNNCALDIAIGRIPLQTIDQALSYVDKVKAFEDPAKGGEWRSRVVMTADDATQRGAGSEDQGNKDLDPISSGHTTDTDNLGKVILRNEPGITVDKVYLLDYVLNSAFHKPEAAQDLLNLINRGTLMVNYVGHGASNQWADEVLLQTNDALSRMHNVDRTGIINAFSCTVGRFESLNSEGMSEQFVKQKSIGAIAAISATRESYPSENIALAGAFYTRAFPPDSSEEIVSIGVALQSAKNSSETQEGILNDAKYTLLGEPVLLMRKPRLGISVLQSPDTIKALDCSLIKGQITGGSGVGFVNIKIVAGSVHKTYVLPGRMTPQEVDNRGNILFERTVPYKDFNYSSDYFIPKQISYGDTTAQILIYAWDIKEEREASTAIQNLHITGTATSGCASDADGKGPEIKITGCEAKETGAIDFPERVQIALPYCLQIQVADSSGGVLTAEGPDEGTTLEIPGILEPFHPQPGIDELYLKSYQLSLGKEIFRPGQHLLKVSARDGYGNRTTRQLLMDLTADSSVQTISAYNVPNPMKRKGTTFYFSTILPNEDVNFADPADSTDRVEFEVKVFNQSGKLVKVFKRATSGQTSWDGRDEWHQLSANGVYFYQVTARQNLTSLGGTRPSYRTVSSKRNVLIISR